MNWSSRHAAGNRWLGCLVLLLLLFAVADAAAEAPANVATSPVVTGVVAPVDALPRRLTFAVVIGNNMSLGGRRPNLHYADDDAARYFEILQTMAPGRVSLLADFDRDTGRLFPAAKVHAATPTRSSLRRVGARLQSQVRQAAARGLETEVYFVFAGHGDVAEGEGFIELADGRFRSSELEAWLRAIPFTRAHVILDSCNSFFMLGVRKPGGRHFATSEDAARALSARLPNVGVFLSTSAEGEAFEWSEIQSGIFSHVVRSGLLGAADANSDGSVSYLELAAFVDTATADVVNPNMRPHVFARGPGSSDNAPIARLRSMTSVRRFNLGDASAMRLRLRDANGVPLLDAHTEGAGAVQIALPSGWARGATVQRTQPGETRQKAGDALQLYTVPESGETLTLALLEEVASRSSARGPGETFENLFGRPYGPLALARYVKERRGKPLPVYGVSKEDTLRMELVLDVIGRSERNRKISEDIGAVGFGALIGAAGIGVLYTEPGISSSDKRRAHWVGGGLVGLGGLFVLGGTGALFALAPGEAAALEFRSAIRGGGDAAQAFASADASLRELVESRRQERLAGAIIGGLSVLGCTTGLLWSEVASGGEGKRFATRLGWGAGILGGAMMLGDSLLIESPAEALTEIWRDDPSLQQYQSGARSVQPAVSLVEGGAYFGLTGSL